MIYENNREHATRRQTHGGKRDGAGRKSTHSDVAELEELSAMPCTEQQVAAFFHLTVYWRFSKRSGVGTKRNLKAQPIAPWESERNQK